MSYAIIDIETTGTNAQKDKITEIAVYIHDGEKVVNEFVSLINPECRIPPFISRLTGISDEMVEEAPKFYEVAKEIVQLTEGTTFVAHNAPFDYGFLKQEFKSLGFNFTRNYLCTVRLSRKILPGFRSYSLGNLCTSLGINVQNRHRAGGDALATVKLFELLLSKSSADENVSDFISHDFADLRFPPGFDKQIMQNIPDETGVYYLYNEKGEVIYVGKSNNIRKRILSHFRNRQSKRAAEMRELIHDVSFELTGNELIALLLESDEIKRIQPQFNRAQRRATFNYGIFVTNDPQGYINLRGGKGNRFEEPVYTTSSAEQAELLIEKLISLYTLCKKLCGYSDIRHKCFNYSVRLCNGACIGEELPEIYNQRAQEAIRSLQFKNPNFFIIGEGRKVEENSIVCIENGRYTGFGYFEAEFTGTDTGLLKEIIKKRSDNRDTQRIIRSFLQNEKLHILPYSVSAD
jgi:DNA polymerase III subunit epsilon